MPRTESGLAAPQIGVSLNVFVYDCRDAEDKRHVGHIVNPEVVSTSGPIDNGEEGCLSVPGPFHELARPWVATLRGVDQTGTADRGHRDGLLRSLPPA